MAATQRLLESGVDAADPHDVQVVQDVMNITRAKATTS